MKLQRLYDVLRALYHVDGAPEAIAPFLLDTPYIPYRRTETIKSGRHHREVVYVRETNDDIELGLYIDRAILKRLATSTSSYYCIDDIACAAEGVSHLLYLFDRISRGMSCSQLELELQGEVDKFLIVHLLSLEETGCVDPKLFTRLFESVSYARRLTSLERDRYETANHFAAKFCHRLRDRCFFPFRHTDLLEAIRPFFQQNLQGKLARLIP